MKKMYEAEIEASHPTRLQTEAGYKADAKAMMLVGERHEKRELVDLIRWLILDNAKTINPLPDSKGDIAAIIGEIANNQEMFISGGAISQEDAKEPRFKIVLVGPERILKQLVDLIWEWSQEKQP